MTPHFVYFFSKKIPTVFSLLSPLDEPRPVVLRYRGDYAYKIMYKPQINPLFPSINIQILLICPKAFLTVLVGRNCFKTGLSSPLVIIFFILITSILG